MRWRLWIGATLAPALVGLLGSLAANGCTVTSTGVAECRQIESARCAVAPACPALGVTQDGPQGVTECQLFYQDQCLHGLAVSDPGQQTTQECVAAIQAAGACAAAGASSCSVMTVSSAAPCDIVAHPELATACAFLVPPATVDAATSEDGSTDGDLDGSTDGDLDGSTDGG